MWLVIAGGLLMMVLAIWLALGTRQEILAFGVVGAMYALYRFADREGKSTANWIRGARSEAAVGETLDELRGDGFTVIHDLEQAGEGNIDHVVSGPTGVFLIETKHRRYEENHLRKAKRQAAKLHDELGVWVTPVICLDQRASREPYRHQGVWIVCRDRLVEWLRAHRGGATR